MKGTFAYLIISSFLILMGCQSPKADSVEKGLLVDSFKMTSVNVKDDFDIKVSLPEEYSTSGNKYPVVFLLDANLYFDTFA